jgi:hypothetical protein
VKGDYLVVQRLIPAAVLKVGKTEVKVTNLGANKKNGRPWWGSHHD